MNKMHLPLEFSQPLFEFFLDLPDNMPIFVINADIGSRIIGSVQDRSDIWRNTANGIGKGQPSVT